MRCLFALAACAALAACGQSRTETYSCANGPDIGVIYSGDQATLFFPDDRKSLLQRSDADGGALYANNGTVWDARAFRTARLTEPTRSILCDQLG